MILPLLVQRLLVFAPRWVETIYIPFVFKPLSFPLRTLSGLLPFSLTEAAVLMLVLAVLTGLIILLRQSRRSRIKHNWTKTFIRFAAALLTGLWLFMLMHGFNYLRQPVAVSFSLPVEDRSAEELQSLGIWLANKAAAERLLCSEDQEGVFVLTKSISGTLKEAKLGYEQARTAYPQLSGPLAQPKAVWLSHYWSYTGITGMYMPLWVEANVNVDQPDYLIPATANHELAHTLGFAREDEAGFVGFLAGIHHPEADFRYSSYTDALIHVLNSLMALDPQRYAELTQHVPSSIWRDIAAANQYWQQFAGPVEQVSTQANHAFLKANLQPDGVYSYGRMVDLLLAWYSRQPAA